ncbi:hypothetical protein ABTC80_18350 [Acinetobacter baumannii]
MDKCREEFEKQRYWIGLFRTGVDFDVTLGEFGRYISNGTKSTDAMDLESFNEKWEAWANCWQHQQAKVEELQNNINLLNEALDIKEQLNQKLREREEELQTLYTQQGINMLKLQKRVDVALKLIESWNEIAFDKTTHWTEGYEEGCYHCAAQLEQALKGEGQ